MAKRARRRSTGRRRLSKRRPARKTKPAKRPRSPARRPVTPAPSAESLLLALARDLPRDASPDDIGTIIDVLVRAYAPDAPLATVLRADWIRGRDDKTARLALAWAREQVRLALVDLLVRARAARGAGDADTVAWLWLAACEALAYEPEAAVMDRAHALATFLSRP